VIPLLLINIPLTSLSLTNPPLPPLTIPPPRPLRHLVGLEKLLQRFRHLMLKLTRLHPVTLAFLNPILAGLFVVVTQAFVVVASAGPVEGVPWSRSWMFLTSLSSRGRLATLGSRDKERGLLLLLRCGYWLCDRCRRSLPIRQRRDGAETVRGSVALVRTGPMGGLTRSLVRWEWARS
jgi:hypothetical protein